jgi:hypothetical protein
VGLASIGTTRPFSGGQWKLSPFQSHYSQVALSGDFSES